MKALTICQPYAEMILLGEKRVENRTWFTNYRGVFAIHAGKSRAWWSDIDSVRYPHANWGAVVGIASLVDCLSLTKIQAGKYDDEYPWLRAHTHTNGPWCWIVDDVAAVGPWPWAGRQGLFDINDEKLDALATRIIGRGK